jgi:drug/metabolite transporter (DMT)-like permease
MSPISAVMVYLAAMALPALLLYRFHALHWSLHLLALVGAIGIGFIPIPPNMQTPQYDLAFGFAFVSLLVWGAGGLILHRTHEHRHKHA